MATITFYSYVRNYNPPDSYVTFSDTEGFAKAFPDNGSSHSNRYSYENRMGRVIVPDDIRWDAFYPTDYKTMRSAGVIKIMDDDEQMAYIGRIDSVQKNSQGSYAVTFTVDDFTSALASKVCYNQYVLPDSGNLLYYRKSLDDTGADKGERIYLDEGITPVSIERTEISLESSEYPDVDLLRQHYTEGRIIFALLGYHDHQSNKDFWLVAPYSIFNTVTGNAEWIWARFRQWTALKEITTDFDNDFDPSGVMFYGLLPCHPQLLGYAEWNNASYEGRLNNNDGGRTRYDSPFKETRVRPYMIDQNGSKVGVYIAPRDWNMFIIRDIGGNSLYTFPYTATNISSVEFKTCMVFDLSMPSVLFQVKYFDRLGNTIEVPDGYHTFTMPCIPLTFHVDSEAVYIAQDRNYNKQMRSLTALNGLVDGVIGGVNQGAMISAFSRDQTSSVWRAHNGYGGDSMPLSQTKGFIGGGIAIAGAVAGYAYTELYANKQAQRIDDKRARVSSDTLLMSLNSPPNVTNLGGLYKVSYDAETIKQINKYHDLYGYQTNHIESISLGELDGYIQGEYIVTSGAYGNRDTLTYIKGMLSYGARFTHYDS